MQCYDGLFRNAAVGDAAIHARLFKRRAAGLLLPW